MTWRERGWRWNFYKGPISSLEVRNYVVHSRDPPGDGQVLSLGVLNTMGMVIPLQGARGQCIFQHAYKVQERKVKSFNKAGTPVPCMHSPGMQYVGEGRLRQTPRSWTTLWRTRKAWWRWPRKEAPSQAGSPGRHGGACLWSSYSADMWVQGPA